MTSPRPKTAKPLRPGRARAAERTREEILQGAARAFAKGGMKTTRMEDIAREAGYTGPALYSYFESKEEIFEALSAMVMKQFETCFETPFPPGLSFRQRLSMVTYRQLEVAERWRDLFLAHLMLGEAKSKRSREEMIEVPKRIAEWFAMDDGDELDGVDLSDAAFLYMSICHGFFFKWLLDGAPGRLTELTERIVSYFFHGIGGPGQAP